MTAKFRNRSANEWSLADAEVLVREHRRQRTPGAGWRCCGEILDIGADEAYVVLSPQGP